LNNHPGQQIIHQMEKEGNLAQECFLVGGRICALEKLLEDFEVGAMYLY